MLPTTRVFLSSIKNVNRLYMTKWSHKLSDVCPPCLGVGQVAPSFKCKAYFPNDKFDDIELKDYKGKYVVLFFYPLDFTFVCPTEITGFSDRLDEFKREGAEILGCSCDSHFAHKIWANMPRNKGGIHGLTYPILSDLNKTVSKAYNVLNKDGTFPVRGLFILDKKGVLRHMSYNDPPIGRSVDEVLRLVTAIKFSDENGEVCPINWKPGKKAINVEKAGDYFKEL